MDAVVGDIKKEMAVAVRKYQWDEKRAKRVFNKAVSCALMTVPASGYDLPIRRFHKFH